jgi:hypothetical protein
VRSTEGLTDACGQLWWNLFPVPVVGSAAWSGSLPSPLSLPEEAQQGGAAFSRRRKVEVVHVPGLEPLAVYVAASQDEFNVGVDADRDGTIENNKAEKSLIQLCLNSTSDRSPDMPNKWCGEGP